MTIRKFQKTILNWYKTNRRDMPWRRTKDPYKILVSEIMLQQTQISRVLPKYKEFLKAFPNLLSLATASDKRLLQVWQGLGYWRRAKYLKEAAKQILQERNKTNYQRARKKNFENVGGGRGDEVRSGRTRSRGKLLENLFSEPKELEKLPGIGHYTARAIACFAFGNSEAFLDTNIRRVYLHFFFPKRQNVSDSEILPLAQKCLYSVSHDRGKKSITAREWHYALFDYGATVLKDKKINKQSKHYRKQSKFEGSFRSFRTKVVKFLLKQKNGKTPFKTIETLLKDSPYPPREIIASLVKDKLITKRNPWVSLD